jgi:hypothetical protein
MRGRGHTGDRPNGRSTGCGPFVKCAREPPFDFVARDIAHDDECRVGGAQGGLVPRCNIQKADFRGGSDCSVAWVAVRVLIAVVSDRRDHAGYITRVVRARFDPVDPPRSHALPIPFLVTRVEDRVREQCQTRIQPGREDLERDRGGIQVGAGGQRGTEVGYCCRKRESVPVSRTLRHHGRGDGRKPGLQRRLIGASAVGKDDRHLDDRQVVPLQQPDANLPRTDQDTGLRGMKRSCRPRYRPRSQRIRVDRGWTRRLRVNGARRAPGRTGRRCAARRAQRTERDRDQVRSHGAPDLAPPGLVPGTVRRITRSARLMVAVACAWMLAAVADS